MYYFMLKVRTFSAAHRLNLGCRRPVVNGCPDDLCACSTVPDIVLAYKIQTASDYVAWSCFHALAGCWGSDHPFIDIVMKFQHLERSQKGNNQS
jgi:hypothetical protein